MRAILCREIGRPDALDWAELPELQPGACNVRIRVAAAGVNFADTLMIEGRYQERPQPPFTPGLEVAGTIDAVGAAVDGLEPGQRVLALVDRGGFAESVLARSDDVVPLPDGLDEVTAAGFAIAYGTAYGALVWRAQIHAGERLLVLGAGGGVGLAAVECGRALGAEVVAVARGETHLEAARRHGATQTIDSEVPDLVDQLKAASGGQGFDVVFDPVGGRWFDAALRAIAWEGRLVVVGFASGEVPQIPANRLLVKNVAALGFYWGSYRKHDSSRLRDSFEELFRWHALGKLRPHVGSTMPLPQAAAAMAMLKERRSTGKIVLVRP